MEGSLSYRHNIGPLVDINDDVDNKYEDIEDEIENEEHISKDAEKELKESCVKIVKTEKQYFQCEKELRAKTEEVEKLKIEIKDLKEILKLKDELESNGLLESEPPMEEESLDSSDSYSWKLKTKKNTRNEPAIIMCEK